MNDIIKPYGSEELVFRYISENDFDRFKKISIEEDVKIKCDSDTIIDLQRIADGSLSPLKGFMGKEEIDMVIGEETLLDGQFFPVPIVMQVNEQKFKLNKDIVLLENESSKPIGYVENARFFKYDLEKIINFTFGTNDLNHPGVKRMKKGGDLFLSGDVWVMPQINSLNKYCLSPSQTRMIIKEKGWNTCVGFQTRNVPHLAHEYLQRLALEMYDGLMIQPIIGWKKSDDYLPEVVMDTYGYLEKEVYPQNKVILSGLQIQMRYAGPKEAILHAIIRQNYGCSHFIIGRDHAGVGGYYEKYEAQKEFDRVKDKIDIKVLKLKGPLYCLKCRGIVTENVCRHKEIHHEEISGTMIRDMIIRRKYPPFEFIRKEIVDVIFSKENVFIGDIEKVVN